MELIQFDLKDKEDMRQKKTLDEYYNKLKTDERINPLRGLPEADVAGERETIEEELRKF